MFSNSNSGTVLTFPGSHGRRPPRERILEAMLLASGELGYEQVAVRHVIERGQSSRASFYKHFEDREDCFAQAYGDAAEWLYRRLVAAAKRQPSWREGLRAALAELLEFCANQPAIARALLVEVHAGGDQAPVEPLGRVAVGLGEAVLAVLEVLVEGRAAGLPPFDHVPDGHLLVAQFAAGEEHRLEDSLAGRAPAVRAGEGEDRAAVAVRKHTPFV